VISLNKKGFTLVELLAVIVILGILATLLVPSIFKMVRNAKENSYNVLIESFEENAKLYVSRHRDEIENYLDQYNYYSFTLNDLKSDNLLKTPITDPRTDEQIDLSKKIYIVRDTNQTLSVCYEERGCYAPIKLVDKLIDPTNIVTGAIQGLHQDASNNFYYYAGSNPNNWVEFNGILWRIVKVNSDNSIKLIYEGIREGSGTTENGAISNEPYDNSNVNNFNNSITIKTTLQNWYDKNIDTNNKTKVLPVQWCMGAVTYSTSGITKASFLSDECATKTSNTYSIGLLSGSEYLYSSIDSTCLTSYKTTGDFGYTCKNQNYLYKNVYNYWTMIPDNTSTNVWTVQSVGSLGAPMTASSSNHIRPVITLKNDVYIDRGNGSIDTPYVLKDIISIDKINPIITMNGANPININIGDTYADAGATAIDNVDGNITNKIITMSNVDVNHYGTYKVTYVVSDISGNKTSISRTVNVRLSVDILLIAGGGGGGGNCSSCGGAGGGGAGGVIYKTDYLLSNGNSITVAVGTGGVGGTGGSTASTANGANGANSIFDTLIAIGGGGGRPQTGAAGGSGGSGGGGSGGSNPAAGIGGSGTTAQGCNGGSGSSYNGGGGGGFAGVGANGTSAVAGDGGLGLESSISGALVYYAGGGGGGSYTTYPVGAGGSGGGGSGANSSINNGNGYAGTSNTGSGGGGGNGSPLGGSGGAGGSGIVIVRYLGTPKATGGNITNVAGYTIHTFTSGNSSFVIQ
jgi:prepilin-type N-terminal cleavage/methylation domain-containing protein